MGAALLISYLFTALAVPVLVRRFVDFDRWRDPAAAGGGWLARRHDGLLDGLFRRPWLLAVALTPVLALGWFAYGAVQTGFMPKVDEGGFVMDYYTRPGTSLSETSREVAQVDAIVAAMPEVATFSRRLGTGLGGDLGQSYHGDYFVRLTPDHARGTPAVMAATLAAVQAQVPRRRRGTRAVDGGPDRRPHRRAAAGRDQAVLARQRGADPAGRQGCRGDRQDWRRGRGEERGPAGRRRHRRGGSTQPRPRWRASPPTTWRRRCGSR